MTGFAEIPKLPDPYSVDDGYGWMEALPSGWEAIPDWKGNDLGDWPHICVAVYLIRRPGVYGAIALFLEHGVEVTTHTEAEDFRNRLDEIQARYPVD